MADTPTGETAPAGTSQTEVSTTSAPSGDNAIEAAKAEAKKELEQLQMRNNQLANDLEKAKKAEDERRQKQLEEKEEFKKLYEETNSKLGELEATQQADQKRQALKKATEEMFKEYDSNVIDLATTAGLSLNDDTEDAKSSLKEKLDAFKSKVSPASRVTPNNPSNPAPVNPDRAALTARAADGSSPMAMAGAKGDNSVSLEYIHSLPQMERLRELARGA